MELNCDETIDKSIYIQIETKRRASKRSSIFQPQLEDSQIQSKYNYEEFSDDYVNKMKEEIKDWRNNYVLAKEAYKRLKSQKNENHLNKAVTDHQCENYTEKVEHFCNQVNNAIQMHKQLIDYKNLRIKELNHLIKVTDSKIRDKLNFTTGIPK